MAKGKPAATTKQRTTAAAKRAPVASGDGRPNSVGSKNGPAPPRALTSMEIGHVAGKVWGLLSDGQAHSLVTLKKKVDASPDLVTAAIGWLAREDKLHFETSGRTVKISLR